MSLSILSINFSHRRGDSGCPCMALLTRTTVQCEGIGGCRKWFSHQSRYASSIFMYNGYAGGGASAKALDTSAPYAVSPCCATMAQKSRSLAASRLLAYVWPRVIVPQRGDPSQTILALRVPHILIRYFHNIWWILAPTGVGMGSLNIPCSW